MNRLDVFFGHDPNGLTYTSQRFFGGVLQKLGSNKDVNQLICCYVHFIIKHIALITKQKAFNKS